MMSLSSARMQKGQIYYEIICWHMKYVEYIFSTSFKLLQL